MQLQQWKVSVDPGARGELWWESDSVKAAAWRAHLKPLFHLPKGLCDPPPCPGARPLAPSTNSFMRCSFKNTAGRGGSPRGLSPEAGGGAVYLSQGEVWGALPLLSSCSPAYLYSNPQDRSGGGLSWEGTGVKPPPHGAAALPILTWLISPPDPTGAQERCRGATQAGRKKEENVVADMDSYMEKGCSAQHGKLVR